MVRIFGQNMSLDMIGLWLFETLICFFGLYVALVQGSGSSIGEMSLFSGGSARAADSALVLTIMLGLLCIVLGLYKPSAILEKRMLLLTTAFVALGSVPIFWGALPSDMVTERVLFGSRHAWPAELMLFWLVLLVGTRLVYAAGMRSGMFMRDVVVLGDGAAARQVVAAVASMQPRLFRVTSAADMLRATPMPPRGIIMATEGVAPSDIPRGWPGRVTSVEKFWEVQFGRIDPHGLLHPRDGLGRQSVSLAEIEAGARDNAFSRLMRRSIDILVAGLLLLLTAPLMLVTALVVWLESPGPVIYRQERVGLGGATFVILKFRSMRSDAERDGVAVYARVRDSRTTRVGRFIRKVRIDELPQLINILRGDMSLVGPRPERPSLVNELNAEIPFFAMRTLVKPGLTGWAQVNFAYTATRAEACGKLSYDLYYIKNRSLPLDLMIVVATVRVLLFQVGAR